MLCAVWVLISSLISMPVILDQHPSSRPCLTLMTSLKTHISKVSPILLYWGVRTSTYAFLRDRIQPTAHSQASCIFRLSPWEGRRLGWRARGHPQAGVYENLWLPDAGKSPSKDSGLCPEPLSNPGPALGLLLKPASLFLAEK